MKKTFLAAATVALFTACSDQSAGVAAGSAATNDSKSESSITKVKSMFAGEEMKAVAKMPAQALLVSAIMNERDSRSMGAGARRVAMEGGGQVPGVDMEKIMIGVLKRQMKDEPEEWKKTRQKMDKEMVRLIESGASEDQISARMKRGDYDTYIAACVGVQNGWELSPVRERKKAEEYMRFIAQSCDFTNAVFTDLASNLSAKTMKDPDAAKEKIREAWETMPESQLASAWQAAKKSNEGQQFTPDLTGVDGIKFRGVGGEYWNDGAGFKVRRDGVVWFGDGHLSGKAMEFALASATGAKMEKTKELGTVQEHGTNSKTGADVGVK